MFGPNITQQKGVRRPTASYTDCESHQTGGLGPEALVTFLLSSFVYVIMPLKIIIRVFVSSALSVFTH